MQQAPAGVQACEAEEEEAGAGFQEGAGGGD